MIVYLKNRATGRSILPLLAILAAGAVVVTTWLRTSYKDGRPITPAAAPPTTGPSVEQADGWMAPAFTFTDQENHPFSAAELRGKVWVADFIFTGCAGACPQLSRRMLELQRAVPDARLQLVSFDVDPDHDTPAKLKQYGTALAADFSRWHFLAPPSYAAILQVARQMRVTDWKNDRDFQLLHSDRLFLIDSQGRARGVYDGMQDPSVATLIHDVRQLLESPDGR